MPPAQLPVLLAGERARLFASRLDTNDYRAAAGCRRRLSTFSGARFMLSGVASTGWIVRAVQGDDLPWHVPQ